MPKWFGRKSPPRETSPGGSIIHRYDRNDLSETRIGFTDESTVKYAAAREEVYARLFGEIVSVSHEVVPQIPHIDIYTYYRRGKDGQNVCALVTGGMSDLEMSLPVAVSATRRVELIFYCSEPKEEYLETIRWLAHFPHNQRTWIGSGHTIPNGDPPAPFWGSPGLDTILFMPTVVARDATLPNELNLGGEPVHFLWVVPLTTPECNLKLAKGFDAILDLFQQYRHPHVFEPNRRSYL
jgi:hypothetical protein